MTFLCFISKTLGKKGIIPLHNDSSMKDFAQRQFLKSIFDAQAEDAGIKSLFRF